MKDFSSSYPKHYCSYPQQATKPLMFILLEEERMLILVWETKFVNVQCEATKPLMFILLEEEWMLILVWETKFVNVQCVKNVNINLVWRKFRLDILIF